MNYVYRTMRRLLAKVIRDRGVSEVTAEEIEKEDSEHPFDELDD